MIGLFHVLQAQTVPNASYTSGYEGVPFVIFLRRGANTAHFSSHRYLTDPVVCLCRYAERDTILPRSIRRPSVRDYLSVWPGMTPRSYRCDDRGPTGATDAGREKGERNRRDQITTRRVVLNDRPAGMGNKRFFRLRLRSWLTPCSK